MISPNPAGPNGTRARILILLTKNGPMTTAEIAEALGLTPKQVRDNSNQARHENLIASGRDDVWCADGRGCKDPEVIAAKRRREHRNRSLAQQARRAREKTLNADLSGRTRSA